MAQLTQDLVNLVEVALDAPMTKLETEAVEAMARAIVGGESKLEMDNFRQLKVRLLIAKRVNEIKEGH